MRIEKLSFEAVCGGCGSNLEWSRREPAAPDLGDEYPSDVSGSSVQLKVRVYPCRRCSGPVPSVEASLTPAQYDQVEWALGGMEDCDDEQGFIGYQSTDLFEMLPGHRVRIPIGPFVAYVIDDLRYRLTEQLADMGGEIDGRAHAAHLRAARNGYRRMADAVLFAVLRDPVPNQEALVKMLAKEDRE